MLQDRNLLRKNGSEEGRGRERGKEYRERRKGACNGEGDNGREAWRQNREIETESGGGRAG